MYGFVSVQIHDGKELLDTAIKGNPLIKKNKFTQYVLSA